MAKKFRRIEQGKKIAGVCTGLADYFNIDVTLVRAIFIVLVLAGVGSGLVAYVVLWIAAPADAGSDSVSAGPPPQSS
jgi:phage shock protein PspC (stress-responsive transcriptional regulator)